MSVVLCETCGSMFNNKSPQGCPECYKKNPDITIKLFEHIRQHDGITLDKLSDEFNMEKQELQSIMFKKSVSIFTNISQIACSMCHRNVLTRKISRNNTVCNDCKKVLEQEIINNKDVAQCKEETATCILCQNTYVKRYSKLCGWCQGICMEIYRHIHKNPGVSLEELSEQFMLHKRLVNKLLIYGDLGTATDLVTRECMMCETELTEGNRRGKVCKNCMDKLKETPKNLKATKLMKQK